MRLIIIFRYAVYHKKVQLSAFKRKWEKQKGDFINFLIAEGFEKLDGGQSIMFRNEETGVINVQPQLGTDKSVS